MKIVLVDDDDLNSKNLEKLLRVYADDNDILQYSDPYIAYEEIIRIKPDLIFMDIEMPCMNGLELANRILQQDSGMKVIFVTAYSYYAIEAFEVYAVDYLLKPVNAERLFKTMNRLNTINVSNPSMCEESLRIKTFGKLEVTKGSNHIRWQGMKSEELFALLVSHYACGIHKDSIIDTLWADYDYRRATGNMQTAIYRVRKALNEMGNQIQIHFNCNIYRLVIQNAELDLLEFDQKIKDIHEVNDGNYLQAREVLELYGPSFLEENGYLWSYSQQALLEKQFISLLKKTVKYLCRKERLDEAMVILKHARSMNPDDQVIKDLIKIIISKQVISKSEVTKELVT